MLHCNMVRFCCYAAVNTNHKQKETDMVVREITDLLEFVYATDSGHTLSDEFARLMSNNARVPDLNRLDNETKQRLGVLTSEE